MQSDADPDSRPRGADFDNGVRRAVDVQDVPDHVQRRVRDRTGNDDREPMRVRLEGVLGRPADSGMWETALYAAGAYLKHPSVEQHAWAHGSLAEAWLLRLAQPDVPLEARKDAAQEAAYHAQQIVDLYPGEDAFPLTSTRAQFQRYLDWWGHPEIEAAIASKGAGFVRNPVWNDVGAAKPTW